MPLLSVHDLVFPSAVSGEANALGIVYASVEQSARDQFVQHAKLVFLSSIDQTEIQRCASKKIPVMVQPHSLPNAFSLLKLHGVKIVLVHVKGSTPILDFGWMQKAFEEKKSVVFSLPALQEAFVQKDTLALQEYRKLAQLLHKSHVPLGLVSLARHENERLSEEDVHAWAGYLGIPALRVEWFL